MARFAARLQRPAPTTSDCAPKISMAARGARISRWWWAKPKLLLTPHHPLQSMQSLPKLNPRHAKRWDTLCLIILIHGLYFVSRLREPEAGEVLPFLATTVMEAAHVTNNP